MGLTIFAQRLKQLRESKGLKQNELARVVGVTPNTISSYERADTEGNGKKPTLENAQAIADTLDVSLDWLCGRTDKVKISYSEYTNEEYMRCLGVFLLGEVEIDTESKSIRVCDSRVWQKVIEIQKAILAYRQGYLTDDLLTACIDEYALRYSKNN
ncbi:MAG: helix-turn-helix domain-containing protein [Huintestinicola sp.]